MEVSEDCADSGARDACPPSERWLVIASVRLWAERPSEEAWQVLRKCPHCGRLHEDLQKEPV